MPKTRTGQTLSKNGGGGVVVESSQNYVVTGPITAFAVSVFP